MNEAELRDQVQASVVRLATHLVVSCALLVPQLGLSGNGLRFLALLVTHGALTPGSLGRLTGLGSSTVTGVIIRLEQCGLARREPSAVDRRVVMVVLEADAVARIQEGCRYTGERMEETLSGYDTPQLHVIQAFLADINDRPV